MLILITGGIKSGKSDFALALAERSKERKNFYFIATAIPSDSELKERIKNHRKKRKKFWKTIEEPENIDDIFLNIPSKSTVVVDCLTLWLSNIIMKYGVNKKGFNIAKKKLRKTVSLIRNKKIKAFFVTNEVGWGIIPENKISRYYADYIGKLNQMMAETADDVYLMTVGINTKIK